MSDAREDEPEMNPYAIVSSVIGTTEAASLRARLMAWHDAMVAHERRLRLGQTTDICDDECPHVEARTLWAEAAELLGPHARALTFLRSRALATFTSPDQRTPAKPVSRDTDAHASRATRTASARRRSKSVAHSSRMAAGELSP